MFKKLSIQHIILALIPVVIYLKQKKGSCSCSSSPSAAPVSADPIKTIDKRSEGRPMVDPCIHLKPKPNVRYAGGAYQRMMTQYNNCLKVQ
jgi:hypothetical protein